MATKSKRVLLQIATQCNGVEDFAQVFQPLCRENLVFFATQTPAHLGTQAAFRILAADESVIMAGEAEVVSPFASGLPTHGDPGMALRIEKLKPGSESAFLALQKVVRQTSPFGISSVAPSGPHDARSVPQRNRALCTVRQIEKPPRAMGRGSTSPPLEAVPEMVIDGIGWGSADYEFADIADRTTRPFPVGDPKSFTDEVLPTQVGDTPVAPPLTTPATEEVSRSGFGSSTGLSDEVLSTHYGNAPVRHSTNTGVLRAVDSPSPWWTVTVALLTATLGLGMGFLLWGLPVATTGAAMDPPRAHRPTEPTEAPAKPASASPTHPKSEPTEVRAPGECHANIVSEPTGAAIFFGDRFMGETPYRKAVPCEETMVSLYLPGQPEAVAELLPVVDQTVPLEIRFGTPVVHKVSIVTVPARAMIRIDGQKIGISPIIAEVSGFKPHQITATKTRYQRQRVKITTTEPTTEIRVTLKRKR